MKKNPCNLVANCERDPHFAIELNNETFKYALDLSTEHKSRLYCPSTIGAYGFYNNFKDRKNVHEDTYQQPRTIYGVTKVYMELLGQYYSSKFGVDFRSLRLPGVLSAFECNGGTTDYAIDMILAALKGESYTCYLEPHIELPFVYIEDLVYNQLKFLETDMNSLKREVYNLSAFSVSAERLEGFLRQSFPDFRVEYVPDFRNQIARIWPANFLADKSIDQWGMDITFDFEKSFDQMILDCQAFLEEKERGGK